jgi:hypothetical protein
MTSVRVGVEVIGRWRRRGGANPLASAPLLIGLRVRVCGGAVGTANVGSRAPTCLTFYMALREGGPTATNDGRLQSERVSDQETDSKITPERSLS